MRIAVISDTHGDRNALARALKHVGAADVILHLGDYGADLTDSVTDVRETYAVHGNSDPLKTLPEELLLSFCGHTLFMCHGHRYGVKQGLQRLYYRGIELGADIVVFGHTHEAVNHQEENLLLLNPGSAARPYPGHKASAAVIELEPGVCKARIIKF